MNSRSGTGNADNHYSQAQSSVTSHHPNVNYTSSVKKGDSGSKAVAQYPYDARIHAAGIALRCEEIISFRVLFLFFISNSDQHYSLWITELFIAGWACFHA
ncbi:Uncharacterized protein Fot_53775 [Forsythia ovata]|uniref:Uncharacterized protein n=1 Tax=Forsythia ovata TaxID=205694 RepID=A0ABD1PF65_9LAMI